MYASVVVTLMTRKEWMKCGTSVVLLPSTNDPWNVFVHSRQLKNIFKTMLHDTKNTLGQFEITSRAKSRWHKAFYFLGKLLQISRVLKKH